MADNHEENPSVDEELAKAKRSMGSRVDPDEAPESVPEPKEEKPPQAPQEPQEPETIEDDAEPKDDAKVTSKEDTGPKDAPMPRAYIPLAQYKDEKQAWKETKVQLEESQKRIAELEAIANSKEGESKNDDIEAFMEQTGFDRETVEGFLSLAEKRLLKPERVQALEKIQAITLENEIQEQFATEFQNYGEPELKNLYPEATPDQLKEAKKLLDRVAHTKDFHDKELPYVIFKHKEDISKIFVPETEKGDEVPANKRSMETSRVGNGKNTAFTAKDFEGATDFSALENMDPSQSAQIVKEMSNKTYENWVSWHKQKDGGIEVTRAGRKITLK